jgi:hypothetical protein
MTPLSGVGVKNLGLIAAARKHFGEITRENQAQVKAWIHQQLEAPGRTMAPTSGVGTGER